MPDVQDLFYHGIRENIRRVVLALGEDRTDKGLTAFEDGSHDWGNCFFARAFKGELQLSYAKDPEKLICEAIGLMTTKADGTQYPNKIPVRLVWHTFDNGSVLITADEMKKLITDIRDESRPEGMMQFLRSINFDHVESAPVQAHACEVNVG